MRRIHVIDSPNRIGGEVFFRESDKIARDTELQEAFECGFKKGRMAAYRELGGDKYQERRHMPPMFRHNEDWDDWDDWDGYNERRRDRRGRFM